MAYDLFWRKWAIAVKILPFLFAIFLLKLAFHFFGLEILSLNPLFTSLVAATIFLLGFLITGVLADYKESEKLPGELAGSIESLYDETSAICKIKKSSEAKKFLTFQRDFVGSLLLWLHKKERTRNILGKVRQMNDFFIHLEPVAQAPSLSRMKQEQSTIRKTIIRIHAIRETSFVISAYAIAEALAFFLVLGMLLARMEPFYESLFFVTLVAFVVLYMIFLIRDLDNPFDYQSNGEHGSEVSLKPLHDFFETLNQKL
jgi:predicted membrane chloride channel (bestrophin family)